MLIVSHDVVWIVEKALGTVGETDSEQIGVRALATVPFRVNDEVLDLQENRSIENTSRRPSPGRGGLEQALAAPGSFRRLHLAIIGRRQRLGEQRIEQSAAGGGGGREARLQPVA